MEEFDLEQLIDDGEVVIPSGPDEDDEVQWEHLIDEIMRGNVIPVNGPDRYKEWKSGNNRQLLQYNENNMA